MRHFITDERQMDGTPNHIDTLISNPEAAVIGFEHHPPYCRHTLVSMRRGRRV